MRTDGLSGPLPAPGHVRLRWLADRHDGRLSPSRLAAAEAHLSAGCATCAADERFVGAVIASIAAGPPEEPPRAAERAAARLLRETFFPWDAAGARTVGTLLLDQRNELAVALRSTPGETRRLLWRIGDYEVDASLVAGGAGTDLLAQVVPLGDDPMAVVAGDVAMRNARGVRTRAAIRADGRFTFRGLAPGVYTLEGNVDRVRFVLPPLFVE